MLTDKNLVYCKETHYVYHEITVRHLLRSCGIKDEGFFNKLYARITARQIVNRLRKGEQIKVGEHDQELFTLYKKLLSTVKRHA